MKNAIVTGATKGIGLAIAKMLISDGFNVTATYGNDDAAAEICRNTLGDKAEIVKVDMKVNGGLSDYPTYKNIELTLVMKKDFTPISYVIDSVYDASRPVLGTSTVTQHGECIFSKVNQPVEIPNEASLIEKLEKGS